MWRPLVGIALISISASYGIGKFNQELIRQQVLSPTLACIITKSVNGDGKKKTPSSQFLLRPSQDVGIGLEVIANFSEIRESSIRCALGGQYTRQIAKLVVSSHNVSCSIMDQYFARISATLYRSFLDQFWEPVLTNFEEDYTYFSVYTKQHSLTMKNQTFRCQANFYVVDCEEGRAFGSKIKVIIAAVFVTLCVVMIFVLIAKMCVNDE